MPLCSDIPAAERIPPPGGLAAPRDGELLVWWATTDVSESTIESLRATLDDDTLARINAMVREADRRRSIVAHGLLRRLIAGCTGQAPAAITITRTCASCGSSDHGKPTLAIASATSAGPAQLQFNLAHSGDAVAVALSGPSTPVGIDVESIRADVDWQPARRHVFTDAEWASSGAEPDPTAARFALWARKEAAAKTTGHGLAIDLVHAAIERDPAVGEARRARFETPDETFDLLVTDVTLLPGVAAAVAVAASLRPTRLTVVRADLAAD